MTQAELFSFTYFFGITLVASMLAVLGLAALLQLESAIGRWVAAAVVPAIALGIAGSSLFSGRNLKYAAFNIEAIALNPIEGGGMILRAITAVLVGLCVASIIARLYRRRSTAPLAGQLLLVAFLTFYICNNILNSFFGSYPSFSHNTVYVAVVFIAVFMSRNEPIEVFMALPIRIVIPCSRSPDQPARHPRGLAPTSCPCATALSTARGGPR